jgi:hypothetical protein
LIDYWAVEGAGYRYTWWYDCLECWLSTQWLVFDFIWWGVEFTPLWFLFLVTLDTSHNKFGVMIPPYWLWWEYWIMLKLIPFGRACNSDWASIDCTNIDWASIDWGNNYYVLFIYELILLFIFLLGRYWLRYYWLCHYWLRQLLLLRHTFLCLIYEWICNSYFCQAEVWTMLEELKWYAQLILRHLFFLLNMNCVYFWKCLLFTSILKSANWYT